MNTIKSSNFEALQEAWPLLFKYTSEAETHLFTDPQVCATKLRCFLELLVEELYKASGLPVDSTDNLFTLLTKQEFTNVVDSRILKKCHAIRVIGNRAAHAKGIETSDAKSLLEESFLLSKWFVGLFDPNSSFLTTDYSEPTGHSEDVTVSVDEYQRVSTELAKALEELEEIKASNLGTAISNTVPENQNKEALSERSNAVIARIDLRDERTNQLLNLNDAFSEYDLNASQTALVGELESFLKEPNTRVFILRGYAGTGKTFITKGLTEHLRAIGRSYVLAAPTGKAAKVIQDKTGSPASTIHKAVYSFKEFIEYKETNLDGSETFKYYSALAINEQPADTVYIIDEASMISDIYSEGEFFRFGSGFLLRDFLKHVNLDHNDHDKKIIFIGDSAQLPPVGMSHSPALDKSYLLREFGLNTSGFELTQVVRQKVESGVMQNAKALREAIAGKTYNELFIRFDRPDVRTLEHQLFLQNYLESCGGKINGDSIVIAARNADVADYNKTIREHFFPGEPGIVAGDKVMCISNNAKFGISNGEFGLIKKVLNSSEKRQVTLKTRNDETGEIETRQVALSFRDVIVGFRNIEGDPVFYQTKVIENLLDSEQATLSSDETKALYVDFCVRHRHLNPKSQAFKDTLLSDEYFMALRVKYGYAITGHKAQGSEWKNVFIKCSTYQKQLSEFYFKWLYTALTRTTENVWLLDPPNIRLGGGMTRTRNPGYITPTPNKTEQSVSEVPPKISISTDIEKKLEQEDFGIPEEATFLKGILEQIRTRLIQTDIRILEIVHQQYQELYTFIKGPQTCRFIVGYNGKEKIVRVQSPQPNELALELEGLLIDLVGWIVPKTAQPSDSVPSDLVEEFLNDFNTRINNLCDVQGITIDSVTRYPWNLRYRFHWENQVVTYDIYFNGKKQFTNFQPIHNDCTPGELMGMVELLLTEGLSS